MGINDSILEFIDGRVGPAGRYLVVSGINFTGHQVILFVANSIWGWQGWVANAFAAVMMVGPAYILTRVWVWGISRSHSMQREVVPFFALAALGLLVSSLTSQIAQWVFGVGLWVNVGSLAGYVVVWIAKFFILERIFNPPSSVPVAEAPRAG